MRHAAALILAASLSLPVSAAPDPSHTSVDAFKTAAMLSGDARMVILGDSFASTAYSRIFCGILNLWDRTPMTSVYIPAYTKSQIGRGTPLASQWTEVSADSATAYTVLAETGTPGYFTLPLRSLLEFRGSSEQGLGQKDGLIEYTLQNTSLANTAVGKLFEVGDTVRFRTMFWATPDTGLMHRSLGLAIEGITLIEFDPTLDARRFWHLGETPNGSGRPAVPGQINAAAQDLVFSVSTFNPSGKVLLRSTTGPLPEGAYVHAAGGVYTKADPLTFAREPGLYYSALADSSWSYRGYGADTAPNAPLNKVFTEAQFTHWLDVTTIDREQPVVFIYYLDAQPFVEGVTPGEIEAMIDQSSSAAAAVGLPHVRHLLLVPHYHKVFGTSEPEVNRAMFEAQRDAMFEIAERRAEVSAVSIYDATGGVTFDGSTEARRWLRANAPTPFQYADQSVDLADGPLLGKLLDLYRVHPANPDAAAYFAKVFLDNLFEPLRLDFNGDGILDNGDIGAFVGAFLGGQPSADLNGDGILDNGDISTFVTGYLAEI